MREIAGILDRGGTAFVTTLVGPRKRMADNGAERIYDEAGIAELFGEFVIDEEEHYSYAGRRWIKLSRSKAFNAQEGRWNLALYKLRKD